MGPGAPISRALVAEGKMDLKTEVKWGQRNRKICMRQAKSTSEEQRETNCFLFVFIRHNYSDCIQKDFSSHVRNTFFPFNAI